MNGEPPAEDGDLLDSDNADRRRFHIRREVNQRLDVYLQRRLKGISRNRVQKLIDLGGVNINGQMPKASSRVHQGDCIDVILPPPAIRTIHPEPIPLDVLYEDEALIVINKQAGLIVHPARSHVAGTLINGLAYHFLQQQGETAGSQPWTTSGFRPHDRRAGSVEGLSQVGAEELRPGVVHRLDKNTTGVMVVAKKDEAHWALARQFERRSTLKVYLAVVHGCPDPIGGVIDQPIGKHPTCREAYAVRHDSKGRDSVTIYRVRERYRGFSLVELELKTGRTHQIRVHLSYMGWPIVGDIHYGGEPVGGADLDHPPHAAGGRPMANFARDREEGLAVLEGALRRQDLIIAQPALHAAMLSFTHPLTGQAMTFTAPLHEPLTTLLREVRRQRIQAPVVTDGCWVDLDRLLTEATPRPG